MSITRHHAEWLSLLEISGPFLSLQVLNQAFPQGLDALDRDLRRELRMVYEEWLDNQGSLRPDPQIHRAWVEWVLRNVLEMRPETLLDLKNGAELATGWAIQIPEHGETLRPDFAIVQPDNPATARMLVQIVPPGQNLDRRLRNARWGASPATRMMALLHATGVPLGLTTNGECWMLVRARPGETSGFASWYVELWLEEPLTLRAFCSLLGVRRLFGVPDEETIEALLADSANDQQEVTDQLGTQVRSAVELLVQAIDRADQDRGGALLQGIGEAHLYEAALKVMMRLVFLLSAEERGLLPLDDPFYNQHYAISTLQAQLRQAADQVGEQVLERRCDAWTRLLAAFRAVHGGIQHDRLTLPAYGGGLFDPDALPFLEGRPAKTNWRTTPAHPLPIDNRTVLYLLESLQYLQVRVPGGGPAERRRISFRALDIEQIGHVYEGLLDHTAKRVDTPVLGLQGTKHLEPEIPLPELEIQREQEEKDIIKYLREQTGRSPGALRNALKAKLDLLAAQRLRAACGNDETLYRQLLPFAGLLRNDPFGHPVVILPGSVYVTAGATRRATGTHYTPRGLTEPIVQHTLEPLVYQGPVEGLPREQWKLRSPAELLDLKICDMAMGSGAFLVQACRYLSERVVEAWEESSRQDAKAAKKKGGKKKTSAPLREADYDSPLAPLREATSPEERLAIARRLVTDRCLYGVDKNPLAVEMAKLSLWLITLDKGQAFTFLDHALKCGDSLVGVDLEQLIHWNLEGSGPRKFETVDIQGHVERVVALRRQIAAMPVRDVRDQETKTRLLVQTEAITADLRRGGDLLVAGYYNALSKREQARLRDALLQDFVSGADLPPDLAGLDDLGGLRPFHWPLEFPEVFVERAGFDAFVGNPPFLGGLRISTMLGKRYLRYLRTAYPNSRGTTDIVAFFFLHAFEYLGTGGTMGLIATNTIAQGDTRQTGLDEIVKQGGTIYRADNDRPWPGQAAVVVDVVHIARANMQPPFVLDGKSVQHISSMLHRRKTSGDPYRLTANQDKSFIGSYILGLGFTMSPEEAQALISQDSRNADVLFPYLIGRDINSSPDQSPSRWVINFFDWPLERAEQYPDCMAIVRKKIYEWRQTNNRKAYRDYWWHFGEKRPALYQIIAALKQVLVCSRVSKYLSFAFEPSGIVYSEVTVVIASDKADDFAILNSTIHEVWARNYSSSLETRLRYSPTDAFETFPIVESKLVRRGKLEHIGETYNEYRRQLMLARQEGLTATYNRFHDPEETAADIVRLRELHVEMDHAVAAAYGWDDLDLGHGFHETRQGLRYTISQGARWEVLDRLLALNHERYEEEVRAGLHEKKKSSKGKSTRKKKVDERQGRLF